MANVGMVELLHSRGGDKLRRDLLAFFELILLAENHEFVFLEPGNDFRFRGCLQTQFHVAPLEMIRGVHHQHRALARARDCTACIGTVSTPATVCSGIFTDAYIPGTSS